MPFHGSQSIPDIASSSLSAMSLIESHHSSNEAGSATSVIILPPHGEICIPSSAESSLAAAISRLSGQTTANSVPSALVGTRTSWWELWRTVTLPRASDEGDKRFDGDDEEAEVIVTSSQEQLGIDTIDGSTSQLLRCLQTMRPFWSMKSRWLSPEVAPATKCRTTSAAPPGLFGKHGPHRRYPGAGESVCRFLFEGGCRSAG